jgi:transcriptional regulator with XRE-family HTH domain
MAADNEDPVVQLRRLRGELRELRRTTGQTQAQIAAAMDWSSAKVIRIESGDVRITVSDLRALLAHYGVSEHERVEQLVAMARRARSDPWQEFRDIYSPPTLKFFGFEASASLIRECSFAFVPGLLQTEEYGRSVLKGMHEVSEADLDRLWQVRAQRQELHERSKPPEMYFVADEAVVRREVGSAGVMRRQLQRLIELGRAPHVSFRVIPFRRGFHPGMAGPFIVLEFPNASDDDVVYLEQPTGYVTRDDVDETATYTDRFFRLEAAALTEDATRELVSSIIEDLETRATAGNASGSGGAA